MKQKTIVIGFIGLLILLSNAMEKDKEPCEVFTKKMDEIITLSSAGEINDAEVLYHAKTFSTMGAEKHCSGDHDDECSEEGYVVGSKNDERRQHEHPELGKLTGSIGQIMMKFPDDDDYYSCTASIINYASKEDILLTAAHCFVKRSDNGEIKFAESGYFYKGRDGEEWRGRFEVKNFKAHPKYDFRILSGYDIAIASFDKRFYEDEDVVSSNSAWDDFKFDDIKLKTGKEIYISGYPGSWGNQNNTGRQYSMKGTIFAATLKRTGGVIVEYRDLDTSKGQSGAPVLLLREHRNLIFAVHVGTFGDHTNLATVITPEIAEWFKTTEEELILARDRLR